MQHFFQMVYINSIFCLAHLWEQKGDKKAQELSYIMSLILHTGLRLEFSFAVILP